MYTLHGSLNMKKRWFYKAIFSLSLSLSLSLFLNLRYIMNVQIRNFFPTCFLVSSSLVVSSLFVFPWLHDGIIFEASSFSNDFLVNSPFLSSSLVSSSSSFSFSFPLSFSYDVFGSFSLASIENCSPCFFVGSIDELSQEIFIFLVMSSTCLRTRLHLL